MKLKYILQLCTILINITYDYLYTAHLVNNYLQITHGNYTLHLYNIEFLSRINKWRVTFWKYFKIVYYACGLNNVFKL